MLFPLSDLKWLVRLPLLLILLFKASQSPGTDILGADLSWISAGKDSFIVSCDLYADCRSTQLNSIVLNFRYLSSGVLIRQELLSLKSSMDVTGTCLGQCTKCMSGCSSFGYGIKKLTFTKLMVFSNLQDCEIIFYPSVQTRPYSITTGPGGQGFYTYAVFNHCISDSNRSPVFTNPPVMLCCNTSDIIFDPGTLNPAGDSLAFSFVPPMSDSAHACSFSGKYAFDKPLDFLGFPDNNLQFPQGFHLDRSTGMVTFRPMKTGESVFSVKVEIFRNRQKIGETRREFGLISISCPLNNFPVISGQSVISVCVGNSVNLSYSTSDIDPDDSVRLTCIHQLKHAKWSDNNGQSRLAGGKFEWTPDHEDMMNNPHVVYVLAKDNNCPVGALSARKILIYVWPDTLKTDINVTKLDCGNYAFQSKPLNIGNKNYHAEWMLNHHLISMSDSFVYKFQVPGNYSVEYHLIADSSCATPQYVSLQTDTFIYTELPADTHLCFGDSMLIVPKVHFPAGKASFYWNDNDTSEQKNTGIVTNDQIYILTVSDSTCSSTDTIRVYAGNFIFFYTIPDLCENEDSMDINQFVSPGGGKWTCNNPKFLKGKYVYPARAGVGTYLLKYEIKDPYSGCYSVDSVWVTVNPVPAVSTIPLPPLCRNSPPLDLSPYGIPAGGDWSCNVNAAEKNNILYPDKLFWGNYKLYYTLYNQYGCSNTDTLSFTVQNTVNITLGTEDSKTSYCSNHKKIKLLASPSGGKLLAQSPWIIDSCYFNPAAISSDSFVTVNVIYRYKHSSGCEVEKSLNINILHNPEIDIDKNKTATCHDTVLLTAKIRYSGGIEWNLVSGEASGTTTDRYLPDLYYFLHSSDYARGYFKVSAKTLIQSNLCAQQSDTITLMTYKGPEAGFYLSGNNYYVDSPLFFYDTSRAVFYPISSWYWLFGDGNQSVIQNPVHSYHDPGKYQVFLQIFDENQCSDTQTQNVYVRKYEDLREIITQNQNLEIFYYPDNHLIIKFHNFNLSGKAYLIDALGKEIFCADLMEPELVINGSNLKSGLYFLVLDDQNFSPRPVKIFIR